MTATWDALARTLLLLADSVEEAMDALSPEDLSPEMARQVDDRFSLRAEASSVVFYGDEDGWHMKVVCDRGVCDFRVHGVAFDLAAHADETLGAWRREGLRAKQEFRCHVDDGYDLSDPKSEGWHDRVASVWDEREKS